MPLPRLTTVARVKEWLGTNPTTNVDSAIAALIGPASRFVLGEISRDTLAWGEVTEVRDGPTRNSMILCLWPATEVVSVTFDGISITTEATGNPPTGGFQLTPVPPGGGWQNVVLRGYTFWPGRANVTVVYKAGFKIDDEEHLVSQAENLQIAALDQLWQSDLGVTLDGDAMTKVTGAPGDGEYAVSDAGVYTFNAAQAGETVAISYGYAPDDLVQVATELVGERYRTSTRVGETSRSTGTGQTTGFSQRDLNAWAREVLTRYARPFPG